jgi:hypothetical protein
MGGEIGTGVTGMEPVKRGPGRPPKRLAEQAVSDAPSVVREALPIVRFTPGMIDGWMLDRLNDRWPGFSEATWRSKFAGFAASNDYYCITNERCVFLATCLRHTMTNRPIIMETLAWSRDARKTKDGWENWTLESYSDPAYRLLELYRHGMNWMSGMKAARFIIGVCSDIPANHLRATLRGEYLVALP